MNLLTPHFSKNRPRDDVLMHYGIEGMKWGIRRFQYEDGSLTEEGKIRYGKGGGNAKPRNYKGKSVHELTKDENVKKASERVHSTKEYKEFRNFRKIRDHLLDTGPLKNKSEDWLNYSNDPEAKSYRKLDDQYNKAFLKYDRRVKQEMRKLAKEDGVGLLDLQTRNDLDSAVRIADVPDDDRYIKGGPSFNPAHVVAAVSIIDDTIRKASEKAEAQKTKENISKLGEGHNQFRIQQEKKGKYGDFDEAEEQLRSHGHDPKYFDRIAERNYEKLGVNDAIDRQTKAERNYQAAVKSRSLNVDKLRRELAAARADANAKGNNAINASMKAYAKVIEQMPNEDQAAAYAYLYSMFGFDW